ncbi:hypothetical protein COCC4DRAFT_148478 [Bipolaris maydis ATCC 48331]|uniref:Uncharacterized protein n=2 Tax=Cochliobolus heterostrophus TaxID=5016 RepID=M2U7F5_COCH5|nr:uncharacterized protein COCC4DRAFT_148478 [Bipolaris maydis ATCC 48331]EMD94439.1 hypothetical protein COCHEDRAFT_1192518 [Bipolaris maydis C5]ENI01219.1 hypothetical protein COCC4DRAFT_148478 [Bipolaris maydis ATCC 48331]
MYVRSNAAYFALLRPPCQLHTHTHFSSPERARGLILAPHPTDVSDAEKRCKRCNIRLYCILHATWLTGRYEKALQAHLCHRSCTSEFET